MSYLIRSLCAVGIFTFAYLFSSAVFSRGAYSLDVSRVTGDELGVVLIVSPSCPYSTDERLATAWANAVEQAEKHADERGLTLRLMGIATSRRASEGAEMLMSIGEFHEISAGRSWQNSVAMKFLFDPHPGAPATPQVVIYQRVVNLDLLGKPSVEDETIIQRRVGLESILKWTDT